MKLRSYISTTIYEYLNEQQTSKEYINQGLFLLNYETARQYAYDMIDGVADVFDSYAENPDDIHVSYSRDRYNELIDLYVDKYNELRNQDTVIIYRLIKLNSLEDLDINNIGMHWSFEESGVGDYGGTHPNRGMTKTGKPYVLKGEVSTKYIDWSYGFSSFMWYGEDQWECALIKGARVKVKSINDRELEQPIIAVVGDH